MTKTLREASKTLKEAQGAYRHSIGAWERFLEVREIIRAFFASGSRTAEA
ncbi:hypothetical protein [Streptomyces sp. NPDC048445]